MFTSCGSLKEGFKNQKKNNSDEFLVQKKSPLVMPPEYGQLPEPNQELDKVENADSSSIKKLLSNNDDEETNLNANSNINKNFKQKLLDKIKKN